MRRYPIRNRAARSTLLVAAIVVIIVVAAAAGAYYLTLPKTSPSASPSPTASASASPSETPTPATSPTSSPSTSAVANFKAGAYAIYNMTSYTNGVATVASFNITIGEDTYNGAACWVLTINSGNYSSNVVISENIDKTNTSQILGNMTTKMYANGALFSESSLAHSTSFGATGMEEINPQTIVGYETVTVPAGTFTNCPKATVSNTLVTDEAQVGTVWVSQKVPAFGMVKNQVTTNGVLSSSFELVSYGGYP